MTLGVIDPCYLHRFGELVQMEISRVVVPKPVLPVSSLTNLYSVCIMLGNTATLSP